MELRSRHDRGPAHFLFGGAFIAAAFVLRRLELVPTDAQAALAIFGGLILLIALRRLTGKLHQPGLQRAVS